jgi:hypothetical protein
MDGPTPWYASRTIWAGVLGMIVPVVGMILHVTVNDATTQEIATDLSMVGGAIAGLGAIYYRIKASQPIKGSQAAAAILPAKGP